MPYRFLWRILSLRWNSVGWLYSSGDRLLLFLLELHLNTWVLLQSVPGAVRRAGVWSRWVQLDLSRVLDLLRFFVLCRDCVLCSQQRLTSRTCWCSDSSLQVWLLPVPSAQRLAGLHRSEATSEPLLPHRVLFYLGRSEGRCVPAELKPKYFRQKRKNRRYSVRKPSYCV